MALITEEQLNSCYVKNGCYPHMAADVLTIAVRKAKAKQGFANSREFYGVVPPAGVKAKHVVEAIKEYIVAGHHLNKTLRPWEVDDTFFNNLDKNQPWWGFEMETGWVSREARASACLWTWDNCRGVTYDGEGEGEHRVEITFQAQNMSDYASGAADSIKFMQWVEANRKLVYYEPELVNVGTHWNMSMPEFRYNRNLAAKVSWVLANTICQLYKKDKKGMAHLGRVAPFGFFTVNGSGTKDGSGCWIEFKGFRTTYSTEGFKHYLKVCAALQKVAKAACDILLKEEVNYHTLSCANISAVIEKDEELVFDNSGTYLEGHY